MVKNNEFSIKSKLLFNSLDMNFKIVTDLSMSSEKRIKALDKIFSVFRMTYRPFIVDEPKEYISKIDSATTDKYSLLVSKIESKETIEGILFLLNPVFDILKNMIKTCKLSLTNLNNTLGVRE